MLDLGRFILSSDAKHKVAAAKFGIIRPWRTGYGGGFYDGDKRIV